MDAKATDSLAATASADPALPAAIPGEKFSSEPAFVFLSDCNLTVLPNVVGCGVGIHNTTSTWQIRYPGLLQKSRAKTFGWMKKGWVSSSEALLTCLLWAWEEHQKVNPSCATCDKHVKLLKGALLAKLGFHIK